MTLFPNRLWHWGQLKMGWYYSRRYAVDSTHIRVSVTLTLRVWSAISLALTCSLLPFHASLTIFASITGVLSVSHKNLRASAAVTSGGKSCKVSTASSRGECREMRSRAGPRSVWEEVFDDAPGGGRRKIRNKVRKTPFGLGSLA